MYGRGSVIKVDAFPTGVAAIDLVLGCGGIPQGRIIELYGTESSGKTTTCLQFIAACQKHHFEKKKRTGVAAFIDAEHALDTQWATHVGVNLDELIISQPNSGEEAFSIAERLIESNLVDLIVIDSVAALIPHDELTGEISDTNIGAQARLMSKGLRKIRGITNRSQATIIFINQIRHKVGVIFGSNETTPGGLALKFYASLRLEIRKGATLKDKDEVVGFRPSIKVVKNKVAPPFMRGEYEIRFGKEDPPIYGIDIIGSLLDVAAQLGVVQRTSSFYVYNNKKYNGVRAISLALHADQKLYEEIRNKTYAKMGGESMKPAPDEDTSDQPASTDDNDD